VALISRYGYSSTIAIIGLLLISSFVGVIMVLNSGVLVPAPEPKIMAEVEKLYPSNVTTKTNTTKIAPANNTGNFNPNNLLKRIQQSATS